MKTTRLTAYAASAALALALSACTPSAPTQHEATGPAACADGAERFAVTGLCPQEASALIGADAFVATAYQLPEGCTWGVQESPGPPQEALLYVAAQCADRTTELEFRGGAHSVSLGYTSSALHPDVPSDFEPVRMFPLNGTADPQAFILNMTRETMTSQRHAAACAVREAGEGRPSGAIAVDVPSAYRVAHRLPDDGTKLCGDYSSSATSPSYWLIRQDFASWVDFGQTMPDFLPESVTWVDIAPAGVTVRGQP
jgi:hypothetical protein